MIDLKRTAKHDPVKRNVEKGLEQVEHTPMDPPSAYEQPGKLDDVVNATDKAIQIFVDEHKLAMKHIEDFEQALVQFKTNGYKVDDKINEVFGQFFKHFDAELLPHNSKEEKTLFPILKKRLIEAGEHSTGESKITAIDIMEDDHVKFIQLGTLSFNLLGLATRIRTKHLNYLFSIQLMKLLVNL